MAYNEHGEKQCTICREYKSKDNFHKRSNVPDGLQGTCKYCMKITRPGNEKSIAYLEEMRIKNHNHCPELPGGLKLCVSCDMAKSMSEFGNKSNTKDGLNIYCKECASFQRKSKYKYILERPGLPELPENFKRCTRCKISKTVENFGVDKQKRDGHSHYCRACALDRINEYNRKNPHMIKKYNGQRRSRRLSIEDTMPDDWWNILIEFYGNVCMKCGAAEATHDHIKPISLGGAHSLDNSQLLCRSCNSAKGNRSDTDYRTGKILTTELYNEILREKAELSK